MLREMRSLTDQVCVVTGAGTGIGRATAELFARDGAVVVLVGRRMAPLELVANEVRAAGGRPLIKSADLTDGPQADEVISFVLEELGRVDVLINNAGFSSRVRSVRYVSPADWDAVFKVNMEAVFRLTQAALPGMLERRGGTIVNVSSLAALKPGILGGAPYSAAKAAVRAFSHGLNSELRDQGVRSTVILPGEVDTPILDGRPLPPSAESRRLMMQPLDVARCIHLAAALPARSVIEELVVTPSCPRDMTEELAAARSRTMP